jgi:ATP-dependent helicase/nuclease subunit A
MLAPLFGPLARAEVSIAASVEARPGFFVDIVGQIDRLVATDSEVLFADFKSGAPRPVAETPEPYLVQIALYQAALAQAWPGKRVRAFLVWTNGPEVIEFDHEMLVAALARAPIT